MVTPASHNKMQLDNPHDFGTDEWKDWERAHAYPTGDGAGAKVAEAEINALMRMDNLKAQLDTPQARASEALERVMKAIEEDVAPQKEAMGLKGLLGKAGVAPAGLAPWQQQTRTDAIEWVLQAAATCRYVLDVECQKIPDDMPAHTYGSACTIAIDKLHEQYREMMCDPRGWQYFADPDSARRRCVAEVRIAYMLPRSIKTMMVNNDPALTATPNLTVREARLMFRFRSPT